MENYVFKLLGDDGAILAVHSAAYAYLTEVWSEVVHLACRDEMASGRIVVTNESGDVLILVGAATARSYPMAMGGARNDETVVRPAPRSRPSAEKRNSWLQRPLRRLA